MNIMLAISIPEERNAIFRINERDGLGWNFFEPETIREADQFLSKNDISLILVDLSFASGAFAEWLSLWHHQYILLVTYGELSKMAGNVYDEFSSFVLRDEALRHVEFLPLAVRRAMNVTQARDAQNKYVTLTERRYMDLIKTIPDVVYILDFEGKFMYVNDAISELGWKPEALIGKHFSEIIYPEDVLRVSRAEIMKKLDGIKTGDLLSPKLFDERRTGKRMTRNLEVRLKRKLDYGSVIVGQVIAWGEVSSSGYYGKKEDDTTGTVGIIRDITKRRTDSEELKESLKTKEILLREIHHRVKNNLQVISSLLNLRLEGIISEEARKTLLVCQNQIHSISMVHEQLFRTNDYSRIEMRPYLESLVESVSSSWEEGVVSVEAVLFVDDTTLHIDLAVPVGLITTELVTNVYKYARRPTGTIRLTVEFGHRNSAYSLRIRDSGPGYPEETLNHHTSVGLELVDALVSQVKGTLTLRNDDGAVCEITFPDPGCPAQGIEIQP